MHYDLTVISISCCIESPSSPGSRDQTSRSDLKQILPTLAYQLTVFDSSFRAKSLLSSPRMRISGISISKGSFVSREFIVEHDVLVVAVIEASVT
jgi:hypothetical protein